MNNLETKLLKCASILFLLIMSIHSYAIEVPEDKAKLVATNYLRYLTNQSLKRSGELVKLVYTSKQPSSKRAVSAPLFYVFNQVQGTGFVIVSGDDNIKPILGYSLESNFDETNLSPQVAYWLSEYEKQIAFAVESNVQNIVEKQQWEFISSNQIAVKRGTTAVKPLLKTTWDQGTFYNDSCPYDNTAKKRVPVGCVATAMAQTMKYWGYPNKGVSSTSYTHTTYGLLKASFGNTTYQWSSMPNQLISSSTNTQINAVATLMYQCGVSVDMNYTPTSSGAAGATKVQPALINYFGYQNNATIKLRSNYPDDTNWKNLLKIELNSGRPMYYEGTGGGSGHAFVCDGYDANDMFHFNWGWSGIYNDYFVVTALNPSGTGTGGGSGTYNSNQKIVIGIQPPPTSQQDYIALYNYLTPSASTISYGQSFSVSTNIANYGTNSFSGDYTLCAFDSNGNFIDYVETKTNYIPLPSQTFYSSNVVFSTTGMFTLLPGTYYLGLYYRPTGGGWKIVKNNTIGSSNYTNFPQIIVVNSNPISLNSTMTVSPGTTLTQGQGASVNLNIANIGSSTFIGQYNVGLYTLDGTFVQTIGALNENNGLSAGYTYPSPYLTFTTAAITATPGTYLIALQHKTTTGNWTLTGSTSTFINPTRVTVVQAPYQADIYEVNDAFNQSYNMPLSFTSNTTSVKTTGSNSHVGNDNDYYKIVLPSGYNYTITPRLQDSYSSNNGNTYSLDALFTYSTDGVNWSSVFDDVISGNLTINNGGTIYFHVAPYFQGNVGTYLLDVNLSRTLYLGLPENDLGKELKLFPNPTTSKVFFDNANSNFKEVAIYNYLGQEVSKTGFTTTNSNQEVDMSGLSAGVYVLKFSNTETSQSVKVVKQ